MTINIPHRLPLSLLLLAMAAALLWGAPPAIGVLPPVRESNADELKPARPARPSDAPASESQRLTDVGEPDEYDGEGVVPVPVDPQMHFPLIEVSTEGIREIDEGGETADAGSRLIYSNTLGIHAISFPTNQPVSDDIVTTAPDGCNLKSFKFKVLGKVLSTGAGGPYTVKYALYSNCPWAMGSGSTGTQLRELIKIPGTTGEIVFPDDGPRAIKHVVDPHTPVPIPANVYLGLRFDRGNCGTVVGAPAMVGFSDDRWDFPGIPCNGFLGGFPQLPHASFWLEMHSDAECSYAFPGYKSARASGPAPFFGPNVQGMDDIRLQVEDCQMVGYELAVRGAGFYTFDLRRSCDRQVIPGTERTFSLSSTVSPPTQIVRFKFDPPIPLEQDFFIGFRCLRTIAQDCGVVFAGIKPNPGESTGDYFTVIGEGCVPGHPTQGIHGTVNFTVTCAGELPAGACCDMGLLECIGASEPTRCDDNADCPAGTTCEAVCREVTQMNCPWPPRGMDYEPKWVEGGVCEPDPFELPCGVAACCKPDDTCENLTENECDAVPPLDKPKLWQAGSYCGQDGQSCPFNACLVREGDCLIPHETPGCSDPFCCTDVCTADPWCCLIEWDRICFEYANEFCSGLLPNDECEPSYWLNHGAAELIQSTPFFGNNLSATDQVYDPGFCCNSVHPGAKGWGSVWFKFVAIAETAQIDTCASALDGDTIVNVFSVGDSTDTWTSCETLSLIGCGDSGCPNNYLQEESPHSRFCVEGLTVGETYYIELASKKHEQQGMYEIHVKMPCQHLTPFSANDCNENGIIDGCDLAERASRDCNHDGVLDECLEATDSAPDCDEDGLADTCDPFRQRVVSDPPSLTFGQSIAFDEGLLIVGDPLASGGLGGVQVFEKQGEAWVPTVSLGNPEPTVLTSFGMALASDNQRLLVSANDSDANDSFRGRVLAYRREKGEWLSEAFPIVFHHAEEVREVMGVVMEGDLAAVWTLCASGQQNCERDVVVHVLHHVDNGWRLDGILPSEGGFVRNGFAIDFGGRSIAVLSGGWLTIYEKEQAGWSEEFERAVELEAQSISFEGPLIAIGGGVVSDPWDSVPYSAISFYRKQYGAWDGGGWLSTEFAFNAYPALVSILTPITLAVTVEPNHGCPAILVYQRGYYLCDWCSYWLPLTTLPLTHCGAEPRTLVMARGSEGLAVGLSGSGLHGLSVPPGSVQLFAFPQTDCDVNEEMDSCEVQAGTLEDCNNDRAPDICQPQLPMDHNLDLIVDLRDFAGLQRCFSGSGGGVGACCGVFDGEPKDGDADLVDFVAFQREMRGP